MPSPTTAGSALSFAQLEQVWIDAGGDPTIAPTMAAIGKAESGGRPSAINPNDNNGKQTSWGLWQVSQGNHNPYPGWDNPITNAQIAQQKLASQGLGAWGTYTSGAYKKFMPAGTVPPASYAADPNSGSSSTDSSSSSQVDTKGCYWQIKIGYAVGSTTICMDDLLWAGMIALGAFGIVAGASFIVIGIGSQSKTARQIASTASSLVPAAKLVK